MLKSLAAHMHKWLSDNRGDARSAARHAGAASQPPEGKSSAADADKKPTGKSTTSGMTLGEFIQHQFLN
jgi:hypothetical protein